MSASPRVLFALSLLALQAAVSRGNDGQPIFDIELIKVLVGPAGELELSPPPAAGADEGPVAANKPLGSGYDNVDVEAVPNWSCAGQGAQYCANAAYDEDECPKPCRPGVCKEEAPGGFEAWEKAILAGAYDNVFVKSSAEEPGGKICASVCRTEDSSDVLDDAACAFGHVCGDATFCSSIECTPPLRYASCRKSGAFWEPSCDACSRIFPSCAKLLESSSSSDGYGFDNCVVTGTAVLMEREDSGGDVEESDMESDASSDQESEQSQDTDGNEESAASEWSCDSEAEGICIRSFVAGEVCPQWDDTQGESTMPFGVANQYADVIDGETSFAPTFTANEDYPNCRFVVPPKALPPQWPSECTDNLNRVGYSRKVKGKPNPECPAGWFLCRGLCYTIVQRPSVGPTASGPGAEDFNSLEARCGLCGGARVAFVGEDLGMQLVVAEAAKQSLNPDKAIWVRRHRFLETPSPLVEQRKVPYQPWHRYVVMPADNPFQATYQRYYTGALDDSTQPQYDALYRNAPASILCVNTINRVVEASHYDSLSRIEKVDGCAGSGPMEMWADEHHRWFPERNWPFPGL